MGKPVSQPEKLVEKRAGRGLGLFLHLVIPSFAQVIGPAEVQRIRPCPQGGHSHKDLGIGGCGKCSSRGVHQAPR